MKNKQFLNYGMDALLWVGFLAAFFLDLTGVEGHQWLGLGVAAFSAYHLILHWNWVKAVTQKLFGQVAGQAKAYYVLDALLMVGLGLISVTGLLISTWLGLELVNYAVWLDLHILISVATLLALVLKIGLHWKWIVNTTRKTFSKTASPVSVSLRRPALAQASVSRREFLTLMGVVGAASVVAAANGMGGLTSVQAEAGTSEQVSATATATATARAAASASSSSGSSSSSSTTSTCRIRCNKKCSYPGHCRRYVDSNANKKCDLGECL